MKSELYKRIEDLLPDRVFDAHVHVGRYGDRLYKADDFINSQKEYFRSLEVLKGNIIPYPDKSLKDKEKRRESVEFIKGQLDLHKSFCGEILVLPTDTTDELERLLIHPGIRGFKCYHVYADRADTFNADIEEYLPEAAWELADKYGMCITLHIVKDKALSDNKNLGYIKKMAGKYQNARLILAHCARGFASWTAVDAVKELKGCNNIFYDVAAVCEPSAIIACIASAGIERVLWGSDYFISDMKGKCVSFGDGFLWIMEDGLKKLGEDGTKAENVETEALYALMRACDILNLTADDTERIFYGNAAGLFGV